MLRALPRARQDHVTVGPGSRGAIPARRLLDLIPRELGWHKDESCHDRNS